MAASHLLHRLQLGGQAGVTQAAALLLRREGLHHGDAFRPVKGEVDADDAVFAHAGGELLAGGGVQVVAQPLELRVLGGAFDAQHLRAAAAEDAGERGGGIVVGGAVVALGVGGGLLHVVADHGHISGVLRNGPQGAPDRGFGQGAAGAEAP